MSNGDLMLLIALLIAVIFGVSWLFQQQGEARVQTLRYLGRELQMSMESLEGAVEGLARAREFSDAMIERLVRSLDVMVVYAESNGGVMAELVDVAAAGAFPGYAAAHRELVGDLRQTIAELRVLSPDPERRMSAAKTLAFGRENAKALEAVDVAIDMYPTDDELRAFGGALRTHVLGSVGTSDSATWATGARGDDRG